MDNFEKYKDYIQLNIINHIERLMGNEVKEDVTWHEKYPSEGYYLKKDALYEGMLHSMMVPYYELYLGGSTRLCCAGSQLESISRQIDRAIEDDRLFGNWASKQDLITAAENWGDNLKCYEKESKRIYRFFHLLELLLQSDCRQDWAKLSQELKDMLFKSEVCYDYKTDEVLCVLHAFTMIMQQDWTKDEKAEALNLLNQHWLFLKHYYSVMTRHIIGVKYTGFYKVAETVMTASQAFKPHMHIFYCGLVDCVDELNLDKKHHREMDKIMLQMQEEMNRIKDHSELLYPLCDAIFPEDFQRLLREHRPKSYKEIEDESREKDELIKQMKEQTQRTRKELDKTRELFEQMVLSSIPIENVDAELELYPPEVAWGLLRDLQASPIISVQEAWQEHYPELLKKYRERLWEPVKQQQELKESVMMVAERPTHVDYYANGSTHDDKRNQLLMGKDKEEYVKKKLLSNE